MIAGLLGTSQRVTICRQNGRDMTSTPVAGWYPDPADSSQMRWWDGAAWTAQTRSIPQPAAPSGLQTLPPPASGTAFSGGTGGESGKKVPKKLPLRVWVVIGILALAVGILLSPIFTVLWLVVLITGIVALAKNTPTWLRLRSRKTATIVTAISVGCFLLTGSVANAVIGGSADRLSSAAPATTALESPALPSPSAEPTETETPAAEEDAEPVPFAGDSSTVSDTSSTAQDRVGQVERVDPDAALIARRLGPSAPAVARMILSAA